MKPPKQAKLPSSSVRASARAEWKPGIEEKLQAAVDDFDFVSTDDWQDLDELSTKTELGEVYVLPESAVYRDGKFFAPATVSVTLNYGGRRDTTSMSDSYPAEVEFTINEDAPDPDIRIVRIVVDTHSFYE